MEPVPGIDIMYWTPSGKTAFADYLRSGIYPDFLLSGGCGENYGGHRDRPNMQDW
jgi:hypothetical protein